jgi:hypothetical protein
VKTAAFLNEIGIKTVEVDQVEGFLPHCRINQGGLEYTSSCDVSDLLHEAGHLATVPAQFRHYLDGNVSNGQRRMLEETAEMELDPDEWLNRAVMQSSDPEATAWGWAVGEHLGIPKHLRILDHHFDNEGAFQRLSLDMGSHFGISGLSHGGFCVTRPALEKVMGRPAYPKLLHWLQPAIERAASVR